MGNNQKSSGEKRVKMILILSWEKYKVRYI